MFFIFLSEHQIKPNGFLICFGENTTNQSIFNMLERTQSKTNCCLTFLNGHKVSWRFFFRLTFLKSQERSRTSPPSPFPVFTFLCVKNVSWSSHRKTKKKPPTFSKLLFNDPLFHCIDILHVAQFIKKRLSLEKSSVLVSPRSCVLFLCESVRICHRRLQTSPR